MTGCRARRRGAAVSPARLTVGAVLSALLALGLSAGGGGVVAAAPGLDPLTVREAAPESRAPDAAPVEPGGDSSPVAPLVAVGSPIAPGGSYVVRTGDTLSSIARRAGSSIDALLWANGLDDVNALRTAQTIKVPTTAGRLYTVQDGDSLDSIAQAANLAMAIIAATNQMSVEAPLSAGQRLLIPSPLRPLLPLEPAPVAASGTTPSTDAATKPTDPTPAAPAVGGALLLAKPPTGGPEQAIFAPKLAVASAGLITSSAGPLTAAGGAPPTITVTTKKIPRLSWPIQLNPPLATITTPFGPNHRGIDISSPVGTTIRAAAGGQVKLVDKSTFGYGWRIVIDHGDGISTLYAHISAFAVGVGDRVQMGQKVGEVGSTGLSTGPHLHLELRVNNVQIDPRVALP